MSRRDMSVLQLDSELFAVVLRAFPGCRVQGSQALHGGVSAGAVVVDLVLDDSTAERVVVRRPRAANPEETRLLIRSEHQLLSYLATLGLPAPRPRFLDLMGAALGLEYVEGAPEFAPSHAPEMLRQMAARLASIHRVAASSALGFLRRRTDSAEHAVRRSPQHFDEALDEARLRATLRRLWPWKQHNPDVLLHGDYWPGNLLWRSGQLVCVLDWEEAELGDALSDVALARLDILWAFGEAAMHTFTAAYREQTELDWSNLARWELCVALRPMSNLARWASSYVGPPISRPDIDELSMREGHARFVGQALRSLNLEG